MFNVAYADKNKIQNSIAQGAIPAESLIITNNEEGKAELSYYDENGNLKSIVKKTQFESEVEARLWIAKYDYSGENISVYNAKSGQWNSYIVGANGNINQIAKAEDVASNVEDILSNLWIDGGLAPSV